MSRVLSNEWPPLRHTTPPFLDPDINTRDVADFSACDKEVRLLDCAGDNVGRIASRGSHLCTWQLPRDKLSSTGSADDTRSTSNSTISGCARSCGISDGGGTGDHPRQITARHDWNARNGGQREGASPGGDLPSDDSIGHHQTIPSAVSGISHAESGYVNVSSSHLSSLIGGKQDADILELYGLIATNTMETSSSRRHNSRPNNQADYVYHPRQNGILDEEDEYEDYVDSDRDEDSLVHLHLRAQHEQDLTAMFQPNVQCLDSSMYETYDDLSSLLGAELSGDVFPASEQLNANNSSSASSCRTLDLRVANLNTRLAKSTESIPTTVDSERRKRSASDSEPLQRSRSLESLNFLRGTSSSVAPLSDRAPSARTEAVNNNNNASSESNACRSATRSACAKRRLITTDASVREGDDIKEEVTIEQGDVERTLVERSFAEEVRLCALPVYIPPAVDRMYHQHQRVPSPLIEMDEDEEEEDEIGRRTQGSKGTEKTKNKEVIGVNEDKAAPPKPRRGEERSIPSGEGTANEVIRRASSLTSSSSPAENTATVKDTMEQKSKEHGTNDKHRTGDADTGSNMAAANVNVPQIIETLVESDDDHEGERIVLQLQSRLSAVEQLAQDLSEQNAKLQEELTEMRLEVEESTDKFREGGEIEEYREMKMELDRAVRDCRILQFRLRKAERKVEEYEQERTQWEDRLRTTPVGIPAPSANSSRSSGDSSPAEDARLGEVAELQQELRTAKDVSIRLHQELEMIEEKRAKTEDECQILRRKLVDSENTRKEMKRELEKTRIEVDVIRRKLKQSQDEESSKKLQTKIEVLRASTSSDSDSDIDVAALLNDLQESTERERDLQHQLQLLEEEANAVRKNLALVEQEKEALDFELERFKMRFGTLDEPKKPENGRGASTEKEAELRLQLMLVEQEATVMRRKMRELEMANEELECALERQRRSLQSAGDEPSGKTRASTGGDEKSSDSAQEIAAESSALQRQLEDVLRENEALRVKLETFEELNALYPQPDDANRGAAEDSEERRAQRMKAETVIASLKRRLVEAEFENRSLQLETESLRKLSEIATAKEPGKGKVKGVEHKLRSQIALLKTEADSMRRKIVGLEELTERLEEAAERALTEKVSAEKALAATEKERKPEPVIRQESTSSTTSEDNERLQSLQSQIGTLQEELGDLLLVIKSKEVTQEQQEKELVQVRQEAEQLRTDNASLKETLKQRLGSLTTDKDILEQRLSISEERSERLEEELKRACALAEPGGDGPQAGMVAGEKPAVARSEVASDDVFAEQEVKTEVRVNYEKCLKDRISALETQLAEERQRCRVAEKKAEMLNGGSSSGVDDEGGLQVSQSEDAAYREREKELLRFELTECHLAIDDLTTELAREKERFAQEKEEMERRLAEYAKKFTSPTPLVSPPSPPPRTPLPPPAAPTQTQTLDEKDRAEKRSVFERESADLQKKMETMAWRREKAELSKRLDELKRKMEELQTRPDVAATATAGKEVSKSQPSERPDAEKAELKRILSKLETEVEILDGECWKYRELAEEMQAKMKVMTAQTEELKASNDILNQERSLLHSKISAVQQERTELDIRLKKEREAWGREKSDLVARQDIQQQENARKLSDIQHEFGQFQLEKQTLQEQTVELETYMKALKDNEKEREEKLREAETRLEHLQASYRAEMSKLTEAHQQQLSLSASEGRVELDEKDLELRSKTRQLEEVQAKVELMEQELEQSRNTIHALDAQLRAQEDSRSKEKAELIKSARNGEDELRTENTRLANEMRELKSKLASREKDWKAERGELQEALEKLKSSLKARDASWESDRSKLVANIKSLQTSLLTREDAWKAERSDLISNLNELRGKLREAQTSAEKRSADLMSRVEAATELVETHKVSEAKFKDERRRLLKQIEDKEIVVKNSSKELERLQRQLDNQSRRIENARLEIQSQFHRDEKIWKAEIAASRFKLEAETKYFKEELIRLQCRLESETKEKSDMEKDLHMAKKEMTVQKAIAERAEADKTAARQTAEKESLSAKRSKQLADELQRDRRELSGQLAAERERCDALQRSYANEKASWDVKKNELLAKIGKLEQQTKLKKVKLEELQVRLQAAWDIERADNRRLVAEANQNSLETRRQADARHGKIQRELDVAQEKLAKEKKEWEDDRQKLSDSIKELEEQLEAIKDVQKRSSQLELRYQRDRDLWRSERADLQKRLQGSLTSRRLEHNRIENIIQELQKLRMNDSATKQVSSKSDTPSSPSPSHSTEPLTKGLQELSIKENRTSSEKGGPPKTEKSDLVRRMQEKVPEHDGKDRIAHAQEVPDVIKASDSMTAKNAFDEALRRIAIVRDDLTCYQAQLEIVCATRPRRSKSHSDVAHAASVVKYSKPVCQRAKQYEDSTSDTTSIQIITTERPPVEGSKRDDRPHTRSAEVLTSSSPKPRRKRSPEKQARAQTPEPKTSSMRVQLAQRMCSTPSPPDLRTASPVKDEDDSEHGSSCNSNTNSASSSPALSDKQRDAPPAKITAKPVLTKFGRFDGQGLLRETDRKSSPVSSDSEVKLEADLEKRMAELDKNRVTSTKKMFEQNLARGAGTLPSRALSPRREHDDSSDHDSDRERHTDSELYTRRSPPTSEPDITKPSVVKDSAPPPVVTMKGVGASAPCGLDSQSARNTTTSKASVHAQSQELISPSASKPNSNTVPVKASSSVPGIKGPSPVGSPRLPRSVSNYPCAPPGFLLPKKMNEVHATTKRSDSAPATTPAQSPPPTWRHSAASGKNFNIPLPPYPQTAMQSAEPLAVIPGQLPRTKSQMQAKTRPFSEVPLQHLGQTSEVESPTTRRKWVSPRSARANFFADLPPSLLMQQQQTIKPITESSTAGREPNNNNNNPYHRPSQLTVSVTNNNETVAGAAASQSSPQTHSPPSKSSVWSAAPAVSLTQHHSQIKTEEHSHKIVETQVTSLKRPSAAVSPTPRASAQPDCGSPQTKTSIASKHKKRSKSGDRSHATPARSVTFATSASPSSPTSPPKPNTTCVMVVSSKKTVNQVETCRVVSSSTGDKGVSDVEKQPGKASQEAPLKPAPTASLDEMLPSQVGIIPALTVHFPRPSPNPGRRLPARWLASKRLKTGLDAQASFYQERLPSGSSVSDYDLTTEQEMGLVSAAEDGHFKRKRSSIETTV
ncbi:A-kinase anchor protein 9-like isoform X2 [Acanthaster planci]|uniref:A-kinase anchor protein 9-like isoform X2 n=1 Tax=Acanthaster planci TaxID=133434 RepID=A0A8B7XR22_ACAPL|nr:A-kinase anchor protein 9-like isoform X2 [Acanthaster planci]